MYIHVHVHVHMAEVLRVSAPEGDYVCEKYMYMRFRDN